MRKLIMYFMFIALILSTSCSRPDNSFRNRFRWLSGKWEGKLGETLMVEQWKWNKSRFEGHAFSIMNGDTVDSELLFLESYGNKAGYTVVVNGEGPFTFALTKESAEEYEFMNPDHDFPSLIRYTVKSDTALSIDLFPKDNSSLPSLSYTLKRTVR
jgi:hypothetical protein